MSENKYTIDELKQKLIQLTGEYINLEHRNNAKGRIMNDDIKKIIDTLYWADVKKDGKQK